MQKAEKSNGGLNESHQPQRVSIDKEYVVIVNLPVGFGIVLLAFLVFVAALATADSAAVTTLIYLTSLIVAVYATLVIAPMLRIWRRR